MTWWVHPLPFLAFVFDSKKSSEVLNIQVAAQGSVPWRCRILSTSPKTNLPFQGEKAGAGCGCPKELPGLSTEQEGWHHLFSILEGCFPFLGEGTLQRGELCPRYEKGTLCLQTLGRNPTLSCFETQNDKYFTA